MRPETKAANERNVERIRLAAEKLGRPMRLMEVCGTHTHAIARAGLRTLMAPHVEMVSGPGCPVCVTAQQDVERMIWLARQPGVALCVFGDMIRVPGLESSLERERAGGVDVRIVYSPGDALKMAREDPHRTFVFAAVGFETTAPITAAVALEARAGGVKNFALLSLHKVIPPAMEAVLSGGDVRIDGFLTPGHVSVIIGAKAYQPLAERFKVPCVATGFEPPDILEGVAMLCECVAEGRYGSFIQYHRAVTNEGNPKALAVMFSVYEIADSAWRGLGTIPKSGLNFRKEWGAFDAERRFEIPTPPALDLPGCLCGEVLKGRIQPPQCPLFRVRCSPRNPIGPCMVSSEGACAASYKYG
ncbi:MAG: hydrogenase formation protein HypD [Candidatus Sumerlaeota bacterium]|nr:hydrogenase formation protein HypD [Candidatus Sumerlaeota bacterium]